MSSRPKPFVTPDDNTGVGQRAVNSPPSVEVVPAAGSNLLPTTDVLTFVLSEVDECIILVTLNQGALNGRKIRMTTRLKVMGA